MKFKNASLKGWKEAFDDIPTAAELIFKKYNTQDIRIEELIFEGNELKKLAYFDNCELGEIKQDKIQRIYDLYNIMGFIQNDFDSYDFIAFKNNNKFKGRIIISIVIK